MTIDLEKLVPMPEPVGRRIRYRSEPGMIGHYPWTYTERMRKAGAEVICTYEEELLHTAAQIAALREQVAREVAKACIMVMLGAMEEAEDKGASQDEQERAGFAAIAAEFGLGAAIGEGME